MIADLADRRPQLDPDTFVASNATVVGSVTLHAGASVWFNAVIRGDAEQITIGSNSNIQDGAVVHADHGSPTVIGSNVTIGHQATVHGCTVGDNALIGINAVVLNNAVIGANSVVGANSLVPEGMVIPEGSLVMGSPAKVKRPLSEREIGFLTLSAQHYADNGRRFKADMVVRSGE